MRDPHPCHCPGCTNLTTSRRFCGDSCASKYWRMTQGKHIESQTCACGRKYFIEGDKCSKCKAADKARKGKVKRGPGEYIRQPGTIANARRKTHITGDPNCECSQCANKRRERELIEQVVANAMKGGGPDAFRERTPGKTGGPIKCHRMG